jgi:glycosyltransferase involved in cell wall biosynthesis
VRCSNDGGWLAEINLGSENARGWLSGLERRCIRAADVAYAPSHFLAQHYALHHDIRLSVVRPPAFREVEPRGEISFELPKRYFLHFGQLTPAKGTAVLAAALPLVWEREPDFSMVWAGRDCVFQFGEWSRSWGRHRDRVHWLQPLARPELYAVLAGADAAVLPSRFDNLPNTVIESLLHGVPVIGTRATSIDELVEPGVNGEIVPANDAAALADAIVRQWRGETEVRKGFRWDGPLVESMHPERAVEALLALAGFGRP